MDYTKIKTLLSPRDGYVHSVMLNAYGKMVTGDLTVNEKFTNQVNTVLSNMQRGGYEIIDVKFVPGVTHKITTDMLFHVLILYK